MRTRLHAIAATRATTIHAPAFWPEMNRLERVRDDFEIVGPHSAYILRELLNTANMMVEIAGSKDRE